MYQGYPQQFSQSTPNTPQKSQVMPNMQINVSPQLIQGNNETPQTQIHQPIQIIQHQQQLQQQQFQHQPVQTASVQQNVQHPSQPQQLQQQQQYQQSMSQQPVQYPTQIQNKQTIVYTQQMQQRQLQLQQQQQVRQQPSQQLLQQMQHQQQPQQIQQRQIQQQQLQRMQNPVISHQLQPIQKEQMINGKKMPVPQQNIVFPQQTINQIKNALSSIQIQKGNQPNSIIITSPSSVQNQAKILNNQIQIPIIAGSKLAPYQQLGAQFNQNPSERQNQTLNVTPNQNVNTDQNQLPQKPQESAQLYDDEFIVEGIADEREVKGKRQYLVQWAGFPDEDNTWEDESNLTRYYNIINDFKINGPKQRPQRRVVEFISGFISNGKIFYNVLYQNDEVACLSSLQARAPRIKQQLLNYLEREFVYPEKERIVIPPKPPKPPKSPDSNESSQNTSSKPISESGATSEFNEEEEEEEVNEKQDSQADDVINISIDPSPKEDQNIEIVEELKEQEKILQEDPIENDNAEDM